MFRDVLDGSGITYRHELADGKLDTLIESVGSGVTVFDADGDGRLDLYFVDQGWCEGVSDGEPKQRDFLRHPEEAASIGTYRHGDRSHQL